MTNSVSELRSLFDLHNNFRLGISDEIFEMFWRRTIPPRPPVYINFFKPFQVLAGDHLVVPTGVSHISLWLQEIQSREWEKRTKNKRTIWAWVNSSARRLSCDSLHSLCICRLTLAWISSEISTKLLGIPTHLDWSSLTTAGLYLMPTGLFCCPVSTAHCPSASLFANCFLWVPSSNSLTGVPLPTSGRVEISSSGLCLLSRQNRQRDRLLSRQPT